MHLLGVAYKKDVGDVRESPALDILELLHRRGATLSYSDPFVPSLKIDGLALKAIDPAKADADCAVICTNHSSFDYDRIVEKFPLIVDTRNALRGRNREGDLPLVGRWTVTIISVFQRAGCLRSHTCGAACGRRGTRAGRPARRASSTSPSQWGPAPRRWRCSSTHRPRPVPSRSSRPTPCRRPRPG